MSEREPVGTVELVFMRWGDGVTVMEIPVYGVEFQRGPMDRYPCCVHCPDSGYNWHSAPCWHPECAQVEVAGE